MTVLNHWIGGAESAATSVRTAPVYNPATDPSHGGINLGFPQHD